MKLLEKFLKIKRGFHYFLVFIWLFEPVFLHIFFLFAGVRREITFL